MSCSIMRRVVDCNIYQAICRLVVCWRVNVFDLSMKDVIWRQVILQTCERHEAVLGVTLLRPLLNKNAEYGLSMDLESTIYHNITLQQYGKFRRRMSQIISLERKEYRF